MQRLYENELNCGIQWLPDGFKVWLGGERSPILAERSFAVNELDRAADRLERKSTGV